MMRRSLLAVAIMALAFCPPAAPAQSKTLTLDGAIDAARQNNLRLKSAESSIRAAKLSHAEVQTTKLPQIQFEASAIYAPSSGHFGYDPAISNSGQFAGQVVAKQPLYDGGIRNLRSEQLGVDIERADKSYRITERDLVFDVKAAFIEVLRSQKEIGLEAESVRQLQEYLELVKQLSKGGSSAYTDVLKTELQLSNTQLAHQKSLESFAAAKYTLAELLGAGIDTSFSVTGTLEDSVQRDGTFRGLSDSASNLELSIAELSIQRNVLDVELTRRELAPTVSLIGDAGLLTSRDNLDLPSDARAGIYGFSVGLLFEIPLATWGGADLREQQRRIAVDDLRFRKELLHRSIEAESKKVLFHLSQSRGRLRTIRANYASAEQNFLLTKSKYSGGGTLSLEVLSAQQLLTDTRLSELQTLAEIRWMSARLEQITAR